MSGRSNASSGPVIPAVLYAAKSTADEHGSIETQLEDCQGLARREGWDVIDEFKDEGFSAFSGNRGPELELAKRRASEAAVDRGRCLLVVQHSDRLARGAGDAPGAADHLGELYFALRRQNVAIHRVQGGPLDDPLYAVVEGQRNAEDSARKSAAVASGKQRQMERGERLGGPVPDGLVLHVERDEADRVVSRRYERDPERAPIVERIFELSERNNGDGVIARTLNAEGHRTKSGRGWNRRRVQDTLLNPVYAGRVVRRSRGGRRLPSAEVSPGSNVEALIEAARYDRITAQRCRRDRAAGDSRRQGGRPSSRYALSRIAVCNRCGGKMNATTSPYKRKDGTQRRSYVCENVRSSTGLCDQPKLDAEKLDCAIVAYLDRLFVDFAQWQSELALGRVRQRDGLESELCRVRERLQTAVGRDVKLRERWLKAMDEPTDELRVQQLEEAHQAVIAERDDAGSAVDRLQATLDAEPEPPSIDALLDFYNALASAIRGGDGQASMAELNQRLRASFEEFRLDTMPDGTIGVLPFLRAQGEIVEEVGSAYRAWEEAGEPEPTAAEIAEWTLLSRSPEMVGANRSVPTPDLPGRSPVLIWATGREVPRPPAQPLVVDPMEMDRHSQE